MTKADIVERVAEKCGITKKESIDMVESVFSIIKSTLEEGEFSTFPSLPQTSLPY